MKRSNNPDNQTPLASLPDNIDAERFILGACLINQKNVGMAVERLSTEDFALEKHRRIFERIKDLSEKRFPIDRVTLAESLASRGQLQSVDGISYLVSLDDGLPEIHNLDGYIAIVKEKAALRRIINIATETIQSAMTCELGSNDLLKTLENRIYATIPSGTHGRVIRLGEYIEANYGTLIQPHAHRGKGIYTGYLQLDDLTGGIFPSEIWLWGAAPAVGKTSIALQIMMHNVRRGVPVLFFSMEMSKQSILNRLACQIAEVSNKRFRTGDLGDKERGKIAIAFEELRELPIYIDDSHALKPSEVASRTFRAMEEWGVQFAELDFIQKMRPDFSRGNTNDKLTEICDALIGIAKDTVPFLVCSQLSREHRRLKQKPDLSDLRESGALEQCAHVIIFPYREEMEPGKGNDENLKGIAEFLLRKNREGELATIKMRFIGWKQIYEDRDYDAPPDQAQMEEI